MNETFFDPLTRPQPSASAIKPLWGWREIVKAILFVLLGMIGLSLFIAGVRLVTGFEFNPTQGMSSPLLFGLGMGVYGLVILAVYLFAVRRTGSSWGALGIREFAWWWAPAAVGLLFVELIGMLLINVVLVPLFTGAAFENPQIEAVTGGSRLNSDDLILLLLLIAGVAPVAEELFFRGMLYPVMRRHWGPAWAIVLNALVFALVHFIPILIPGLFFVGLILAWVREQSGAVLPGILLHALQNGLAVLAIFAVTRM